MDLNAIQQALREQDFDAWLFYDHHRRDEIAYSILGLPEMHVTRRWFYLIPATGEPVKLNHRVEPRHLASLPGEQQHYGAWRELHQKLAAILKPYKRIAMQYSPNNDIMYVSLVDGGMLELIRSFGVEVGTSADLVSRFEATLTDEPDRNSLRRPRRHGPIMTAAFQEIGHRVRNGGWDEWGVRQWIGEAFQREHLVTDDLPIVGANENAGNPHYEPTAEMHQTDPARRPCAAGHVGQEGHSRRGLLRHHLDRRPRPAIGQATGGLPHRARRPQSRLRKKSSTPLPPRAASKAGRLMRSPVGSSKRPDTASGSSIAPDTPSAPMSTAMAPTWTTWKPKIPDRF